MASNTVTYAAGDEYPTLTLPWQEELSQGVWTDLDLSSGWTFAVTLTHTDGSTESPSPVVTGADGSVNIAWAADDLAIATGVWELSLVASETASSKQRSYSPGDPVRITIT